MNRNLPAPRGHFPKRTLILVLACVTALALMVPALAHGCGHHGRRAKTQTQVTVCTVKDCETAGRHTHNGVTYCGYAHENGVCDGKCLALCPVEDCSLIGRHTHDGTVYCGTHHEDGFCTGTCAASVTTASGHHHGHHH